MKHRPNRARNPTRIKKSINWELAAIDLADAYHELHRLLNELGHPRLTHGGFKITLNHIVSHLLCAWNVRFLTNEQWETLSEEDWDKYWAMPTDFFPSEETEKHARPKQRPGKFDRPWARRYLHRHWTRPRR